MDDWKQRVKTYCFKVDDDQIVEMMSLGEELAIAYIGDKLGYEPKKIELIEVKEYVW